MFNFINVRRAKYGAAGLLTIFCIAIIWHYLRINPANKVEQNKKPIVEVKKADFVDVKVSDAYIGRDWGCISIQFQLNRSIVFDIDFYVMHSISSCTFFTIIFTACTAFSAAITIFIAARTATAHCCATAIAI